MDSSASEAPAREVRGRLSPWDLLAVPALAFVFVFFFVPLLTMAQLSVSDPSPANYAKFASSGIYLRSLLQTVRTGFEVTLACLILGFPYAYSMWRSVGWRFWLLTFFILLPFWTSVLVRTYAWAILLMDTGPLNAALEALGLPGFHLFQTTTGNMIGLTYILLPFMVLPIYAALRAIDDDYPLAASSLGASPFRCFILVELPLAMRGIASGALLVFVLTLGAYITPAILGSPRTAMFSEQIVQQISRFLNFGFGSALAMILLVVTFVVLGIGRLATRHRDDHR